GELPDWKRTGGAPPTRRGRHRGAPAAALTHGLSGEVFGGGGGGGGGVPVMLLGAGSPGGALALLPLAAAGRAGSGFGAVDGGGGPIKPLLSYDDL
ncbi:hypothetical protein MNEG_16517, partial [Monoraphidium neglectum]